MYTEIPLETMSIDDRFEVVNRFAPLGEGCDNPDGMR